MRHGEGNFNGSGFMDRMNRDKIEDLFGDPVTGYRKI
jgi:hypothetical protein